MTLVVAARAARAHPSRWVRAQSSKELEMSYVSCPQCGLSLRLSDDGLALVHCPRCAGRGGEMVLMEPTGARLITGRRVTPPRAPAPAAVLGGDPLSRLPPGD
jgi:hypothetical protein